MATTTSPLPPVASESAALRSLDLPSTPKWRRWLRSRLPHVESGGGYVYPESAVAELAANAGARAASDVGRLQDRRGPSAR
jgi:hypothetical protein